jgi:hypothetical protein
MGKRGRVRDEEKGMGNWGWGKGEGLRVGNWGRVKCGEKGGGKMGVGLTVEIGDEWEKGRVKSGKKEMA